ncbi:hypothetical protein [Streptomyces sp. URMC 123]|uniref:hypothetical protein n=1 Tax=Streptomyces sp. URMC 123 TaxID=3423403 RepID=UPI003F1A7F90
MVRHAVFVIGAALLAVGGTAVGAVASAAATPAAVGQSRALGAAQVGEPGNYVVLFTDATPESEIDKARQDVIAHGGVIRHEYRMPGFRGFAGYLTSEAVTLMESNPYVKVLERDPESPS